MPASHTPRAAATFALLLSPASALPVIDGDATLPGLAAPVIVERDEAGVPSIKAQGPLDEARATGFIHAQDRFFQMDMARRNSAGELAELAGRAVLAMDQSVRKHRLRSRAESALKLLPEQDRALLQAYADGVNAALKTQPAPPEYALLKGAPQEWAPQDSLLVLYSMALFLEHPDLRLDISVSSMRHSLPQAAADFYFPAGTEWDAALDGSSLTVPPVPSAELFNIRNTPALKEKKVALQEASLSGSWEPRLFPGSNAFVISGSRTASGAAMVANDMHLRLMVPNTWYRLSLHTGADPAQLTAGVSMPGAPGIIAGSNGRVAWGFTAAMADTTDYIDLETSPDKPGQYREGGQWRAFVTHKEVIRVSGGDAVTLEVKETVWGPVTEDGAHAIRWTMHQPDAVNLKLLDFSKASSAADLISLAPLCGTPVLNLLCGDAQGHIGWSLCGRVPKRRGFSGQEATSWADGSKGWDGWLPAGEYPRVVDPADGILWSSNNRHLGTQTYRAATSIIADMGARAGQIRDGLTPLHKAAPADLLAVQLDDRALFLTHWQKLLLDVLKADEPDFAAAREDVSGWGARASVDSRGYPLVRAFRLQVLQRIYQPVLQLAKLSANSISQQAEQPVWTLLTKRPPHLLPADYQSYDELLLRAAQSALEKAFPASAPVESRTWGELNRARISHPVSQAAPIMAAMFDMPKDAMAGDTDMPRVARPAFGASERFVVSPGREGEGIFHMPCGQSGIPASPFYRAGHEDWLEGKPSPFLPGAMKYRLTLKGS